MRKMLWAGAGALLLFFFDPVSGRRRRAQLGQRVPAFFRHRAREAERAARAAGATAYGLRQKASHLQEEPKEGLNDPTIKSKVESELFRDADVPKGQINVNVQEGVVQLRGEVKTSEMIDDLVDKARSVQGVRDVENLLHLPGAEARTHQ
jgi:osmotically-inducible protein OsmY